MTTTLSTLRTDRITASRIPAVLGISPYQTRSALMREMVREHFGDPKEFTGNPATDYGTEHEADVIAEYEMLIGAPVTRTFGDQGTIVHPKHDFLAATPDAMTDEKIVECKAPWRSRYTSVAERPDYEVQIRLQMEVTGFKAGDLAIWHVDRPLIIDPVKHDPRWLKSVLPTIESFMAEFHETIGNPELAAKHREPLVDVRTDAPWVEAATEWLDLDYMVKLYEDRRTAIAERLKALSPDKPARGAGVNFMRYSRRGAVDYRRLLADLKIQADLEHYRKPAIAVTAIARVGE